jgi:hypothetical protein
VISDAISDKRRARHHGLASDGVARADPPTITYHDNAVADLVTALVIIVRY